MGRGAVGPPSGYSRQVATNVERLRLEAGLSVAHLASAAEMSRSYYQSRARLESPFNTNDIEALGRALGVRPHELAGPEIASEAVIRADGATLGPRLALLMSADSVSIEELIADGLSIEENDLRALVSGSGAVLIPESDLTLVADRFNVDAKYLLSPHDAAVTDRVEAEIELRIAMNAVGAKSVQMRAVGDVTPAALRAIARSLREIDDV